MDELKYIHKTDDENKLIELKNEIDNIINSFEDKHEEVNNFENKKDETVVKANNFTNKVLLKTKTKHKHRISTIALTY